MTESERAAGRRLQSARYGEAAAAVGVALAAIAMLFWTWDTWPDVVNDSGRELYVAWQLAEGRVLYRDIAYFNGPLSPYINAFWFALVGPGIAKLEAANGVILAAIAAATWHLVRRVAGFPSAAASVLVLSTLFAFGPLTTIGSFSYLLPYSHEMTHGLFLLLLLLAALDRFLRIGGRLCVVLAGFLLGLILLTKPELAIAGCTVAVVGFGLAVFPRNAPRRIEALWPFPFAVAAPPLAAFIALARVMPAGVAFDGILGSWTHVTSHALRVMPYFRIFMGTDHPLLNLVKMLSWSIAWTAAFGAAVAAGRLFRKTGRYELPTAAILAAAAAALLFAGRGSIPWRDAFRPLPLLSVALTGWAIVSWRLKRGGDQDTARLALVAAASAMSFALMLKTILFARIWHYGFVLGMPGTMLAVAAGMRGAPLVAERRGGSGRIAGGVVFGVLIGVIASHLVLMAETLRTRVVPVGSGNDSFRSDGRGIVIGAALAALEQVAPHDATLAVLPDGVMLSYLARRPNSTPYIIGNPVDVAIFGEARMLASYRAKPPDFIALPNCDTSIYGFASFGQGYAEQLAAWIDANYTSIGVARTADDRDDAFRVVLLKRRDAEAAATGGPRP